MFIMATVEGRLCELRVGASLLLEEMTQFRARLATLLQAVPGKVVFCSDLRATGVLQKPVMDQLVALMRTDNPKVERNGLLVSTSTFGMQMERLVADTLNAGRRVFYDRERLEPWLGPALTPAEAKRLRAFLDEGASLSETAR